jgi:hypothetical protein
MQLLLDSLCQTCVVFRSLQYRMFSRCHMATNKTEITRGAAMDELTEPLSSSFMRRTVLARQH